MKTANLCRKHGISDATFYKWKAKYGLGIGRARIHHEIVSLIVRDFPTGDRAFPQSHSWSCLHDKLSSQA